MNRKQVRPRMPDCAPVMLSSNNAVFPHKMFESECFPGLTIKAEYPFFPKGL